jgi:exopolyphosphatase/guanosine-5'-triphosphate,3'-diphosphate pyrophosphatase
LPRSLAAADRVRCACIDVGSNTTRLLVAESIPGGMRDLCNERVFTLIGRSLADDLRIPDEKIEETAAAVAAQAERARALGAEVTRAVATAAIRRASNGDELAAAVEREAAIPLEVLAGDEEARLAYRGAAYAFGERCSLAVVDVGGGSTEIAFGDSEGSVTYATSIAVGSSTLAERHLSTDPPEMEDVARARAEVADAFEGFEPRPVDRAVAVGGSASSLQSLAGRELGQVELAEALDKLLGESCWDLAHRFELDPERVRLMPAGLVVLMELSLRLGRSLRVVKGGLREGVILEMLGNPTT